MQRSRRGSYGFGMLILSGALAFGTTPLEVAAANQPSQAPVEFFGCTALKGTAQQFSCMLVPDDQLTLWVRGRDCKDIQVADSGQPLQAETKFIQNGCQLRLPRSSGLHQSTLTLTDRRTQQPLWSMPLDRSKPKLLATKRKVVEGRTGNLEDLLTELQRKETQNLDPEGHIDVTYSLGWVNFRLGNIHEAVHKLSYVSSLARTAGYISISLNTNLRRATFLRKDGLVQEAQQIVAETAQLLIPAYMDDTIFYDWESALIERASEHYESAAKGFDVVIAAAERIDDRDYIAVATPISAETWLRLGRSDAAERAIQGMELLMDGKSRCIQSAMLSNVASVGIQIMNDSGKQIAFVGRSLYANALLALEYERDCPTSNTRSKILLLLAHIAHANGRFKESRDWFEKSKALPWSAATARLERLEMEALLARGEGNTSEASRAYSAMMAEALKSNTAFHLQYLCDSVLGIAEMNQLQGRVDEKIDSTIRTCLQSRESGLPVPIFRHIERRSRALGFLPQ